MSDITRLYVAKYGAPPVGKKIFIRIQQMNDYVGNLVQVVSAIVPADVGQGRQGQRGVNHSETIAKP